MPPEHRGYRAVSLPDASVSAPYYSPHSLRSKPDARSEAKRGSMGIRTLNDPDEPYLELVFVHGLMGDSQLTWTFNEDGATFWPEWLVKDADFSNARIHTFGYDGMPESGRIQTGSLWEVARVLNLSMDQCIRMRGDSQNPIIFIAHSLGGIVVKAAILSASRAGHDIAERFHAVLFLATPHEEASDTTMLHRIIKACDTASTGHEHKIEPNSESLNDINETFLAISRQIKMWSFYESSSNVVVEKRRAVLRTLPNCVQQVNASHAGVARFRDDHEPAYLRIREILLETLGEIQADYLDPENTAIHIRSLKDRLRIPDIGEDDLTYKIRDMAPGSCQWLLEDRSFIRWRDRSGVSKESKETTQIYWLSGDPACGKSYLAARVIAHLQERNCDTSFFFIKHADTSKQKAGNVLKSIVLQMAQHHVGIRRSLLALGPEDASIDHPKDLRTIWRQYFIQKIFKAKLTRPQYWVLDALDECASNGTRELLPLLQDLPEGYHVFITCRNDQDTDKMFRQSAIEDRISFRQIEKANTSKDIRAFLEHNQEDLHTEGVELQTLITRLVRQSNGIFLWTRLILRNLENAWSTDAMSRVLENSPDGMYALYSRMLLPIANGVNAKLASAILKWVVCAASPMHVSELRTAVMLTTGDKLQKTAQAIQTVCGSFVRVNNDRVYIVHDTAREYFFSKATPKTSDEAMGYYDFPFDKSQSHEQLAIHCVNYLSGIYHAPPRAPDGWSLIAAKDRDPFLYYASNNFSEHLAKSASAPYSDDSHKLIEAMLTFFRGPLMSWIKGQTSDKALFTLTSAGKNLKAFVAKRQNTPAHLQVNELQYWADDLIHLVTVFGKDLAKDPGIIHKLPALCPASSRLHVVLDNPDAGLRVDGLSRSHWPDHISSASFNDYATALACSAKYYAVATRGLKLVVFQAATCQEVFRFDIAERIRTMEFAHGQSWLVAGGRAKLVLYSLTTRELLWSRPASAEILALSVTEDDSHITVVTRNTVVEHFDVATGERTRRKLLHLSDRSGKTPEMIYVSHQMDLAILKYRNEEIELYGLASGLQSQGRIGHTTNVEAIAFNAALGMIAMSSFDGEICTVDLHSLQKKSKSEGNVFQMAVSKDGKTLVTGGAKGGIQIRDFETLDLLHTIQCDDTDIIGLLLSSNDLRILDLRREVLNVWEPTALVRRSDDNSSRSDDLSLTVSTTSCQHKDAAFGHKFTWINVVAPHHSSAHFFCGRDDGSVVLHERTTGKMTQSLFEFGKTPVLFLAWNEFTSLLASADNSGTVKLHRVSSREERHGTQRRLQWQVKEIGKFTSQQPVRQVLFSIEGDYLLVATTAGEEVLATDGLRPIFKQDRSPPRNPSERSQKWLTFLQGTAGHKRRFYEASRTGSHKISWHSGRDPAFYGEALKPPTDLPGRPADDAAQTVHLVAVTNQTWAVYDSSPSSAPCMWSPATGTRPERAPNATVKEALARLEELLHQVSTVIGVYMARLVFVSLDHWVCSIPVDQIRPDNAVTMHFPVPHYWRDASRPTLALVTSKGDLVFAVGSELAVVKNGLV